MRAFLHDVLSSCLNHIGVQNRILSSYYQQYSTKGSMEAICSSKQFIKWINLKQIKTFSWMNRLITDAGFNTAMRSMLTFWNSICLQRFDIDLKNVLTSIQLHLAMMIPWSLNNRKKHYFWESIYPWSTLCILNSTSLRSCNLFRNYWLRLLRCLQILSTSFSVWSKFRIGLDKNQ